jgi:hypothetical protein
MDRRTVLKGGFTLAVTAHTAAIAPAIIGDDAPLIALGEKLIVAWDEEKKYLGADEGNDDLYEAAYHVSQSIVHEIEKHRAYTIAGLQVKSLAVAWCYGTDEVGADDSTTDVRLSSSIVRDLLSFTV